MEVGNVSKLFMVFYLRSSGALCSQTLVALCGVSGSHHCQRELLDRVGKQPNFVSP